MPAEVIRDFPPVPVMARCDRTAVTTVLRNLLVNACKYAPGRGRSGRCVMTAVGPGSDAHDEGPGIPAADLPHVFERFYRGDVARSRAYGSSSERRSPGTENRGEKTRSREEGGSGLGLAIVQGLVQRRAVTWPSPAPRGRGPRSRSGCRWLSRVRPALIRARQRSVPRPGGHDPGRVSVADLQPFQDDVDRQRESTMVQRSMLSH